MAKLRRHFRDDPTSWPYIVMELVNGETLRDRLERGPLAPVQAVTVMAQLCDALSMAHRRGVIHRDLKPENMILKFKNGRPVLTSPSRGEHPEAGGLRSRDQVQPFGIHVQAVRYSRLRCPGSH